MFESAPHGRCIRHGYLRTEAHVVWSGALRKSALEGLSEGKPPLAVLCVWMQHTWKSLWGLSDFFFFQLFYLQAVEVNFGIITVKSSKVLEQPTFP